MSFSSRTKMIVWGKAAGVCSFAACRVRLAIQGDTGSDRSTLLGEFAHNVAETPDGPRGREIPPGGSVDSEANALVLCPTHHTEIDRQPQRFTVERLTQIKADHERWVRDELSPQERFAGAAAPEIPVREDVHSTVLAVVGYPSTIYSAPCSLSQDEVKALLKPPHRAAIMLPFIIRDKLYTFYNLRRDRAPFAKALAKGPIEQYQVHSWWRDDDRVRWYIDLLNRTLNKLTGRLGLNLDREHHRYYFEPSGTSAKPAARSVPYKSLSGRQERRQVAWRPQLRHSGELRKYWEHLAVGLKFHHVGERMWVLSVRPERRFTRDGWLPITPRGTGRRSTSRKSKMYNEQVLVEVNFWRQFLSGARPRIVCDLGEQRLMIGTELLHTRVQWPGVPDDALPFTDTAYEEDLFTVAELMGLDEEVLEWDDA